MTESCAALRQRILIHALLVELSCQTQSAVRLMAVEPGLLFGAVPGALTLTGWSLLQDAVDFLRGMNAGKPCNDGAGCVSPSHGGSPT
jgi:hypothetical protein